MWDPKVIERILNATRNAYHQADLLGGYTEKCSLGLFPDEIKLADRYFKPKGKVLVLGCGPGRECFPLAEKGFSVTGLDFSEKMLEIAEKFNRKKGSKVRFVKGDFLNIPEEIGKFDAIFYSRDIMSHVPSKELRVNTLRKTGDSLEPGGIILFFLWWISNKKKFYYHNPLVKYLRTLKRRILDAPLQEAGDRLYKDKDGKWISYSYLFQRPEEIAEEVKATGLKVVHHEGTGWVLQPPEKAVQNKQGEHHAVETV